jgi:hypothetical protein
MVARGVAEASNNPCVLLFFFARCNSFWLTKMYLLYFGIGGKSNHCASHLKHHLNGRIGSTKGSRDSSLNHFVTGDKVVKTCVFKLDFEHLPSLAEQVGINFVTATAKQTNTNASAANKSEPAKIMYYYMMLVLDPGFSAEEIRTKKKRNSAKPTGMKSFSAVRAGDKRKLQKMQQPSSGGSGVYRGNTRTFAAIWRKPLLR